MQQSIFVPETSSAEREMLDDTCRRLTMHSVSVRQCVLEAGHDTVNVVLAHLSDVFEQERHGLQASVPYIQIGCAVLVKDGRYACEGSAGFLRTSQYITNVFFRA